jgi:polysaccharide export outer membrane protein
VAVAVGDRVRVRVWREPQLSDEFMVDENGSIVFPRLGRTTVAGRSIASLQDTLTARYAEYLRNPEVTVTVLRRVGVLGEVRAPTSTTST